jgi:hypothetical protein
MDKCFKNTSQMPAAFEVLRPSYWHIPWRITTKLKAREISGGSSGNRKLSWPKGGGNDGIERKCQIQVKGLRCLHHL